MSPCLVYAVIRQSPRLDCRRPHRQRSDNCQRHRSANEGPTRCSRSSRSCHSSTPWSFIPPCEQEDRWGHPIRPAECRRAGRSQHHAEPSRAAGWACKRQQRACQTHSPQVNAARVQQPPTAAAAQLQPGCLLTHHPCSPLITCSTSCSCCGAMRPSTHVMSRVLHAS